MVIDSHALLWWLEGSGKLSPRAGEILSGLERGEGDFVVSAVTFWEIRLKEVRGQLEPKTPVSGWPRLLARLQNLRIVNSDAGLWLATAELKWSHRDPADRMIAATARRFEMPVLTVDGKFHDKDSPVKAVW
jgi:PIN domain nuclease of toxin-antitoxin system